MDSASYWSGVTDLQTGFEKIRSKHYKQGAFYLLKGSLHVSVLLVAVRLCFFNARPLPSSIPRSPSIHINAQQTLEKRPLLTSKNLGVVTKEAPANRNAQQTFSSKTQSPLIDINSEQTVYLRGSHEPDLIPKAQAAKEYNYCAGEKNPITVVTAYDDKIKEYAEPIIENQRAYAEKQGYCYAVYKGNLAHDNGIFRAPYWSKIVAISDQSKKAKPGNWIVWMDASAIVTNPDQEFREIIDAHGKGKDVILTTDAYQKGVPNIEDQGTPINNAVFAFQWNDWTRDWLQKIWSRSDLSIGGQGNCGNIHFPHCHYEQQAMTELWRKDSSVRDHTALISNRKMNSFYRFSHIDYERKMDLDYGNDDQEKSHWHSGDFICKVTGMAGNLRNIMTRFVLDNCINKDCNFPKNQLDVDKLDLK